MGGGAKIIPNVPDYRRYKWEDYPQIVKHQKRLAEHGLKDPWARNYAWKFINPLTNNRTLPWYMYWKVNSPLPRGFTIGFAVIGAYILFDKLSGRAAERKKHGHH